MGSSEHSQHWQQMETTGASHHSIAHALPRLRRRGERPWPGSLHHYVCDAEGDNTSLARHLHYTPAKPRETTLLWPGTTPSRLRSRGTTLARHHTATAHGSASQIKKIFRNIKPFSVVKDFFGGGEIIEFHFGTPLFYNCRRLQQRHHSGSDHLRNHYFVYYFRLFTLSLF